MNLHAFILSSIIVILIPGTGVIYTVSVGLAKGKGESVIAALGCTAGILPHLCVSTLLSSLILRYGNQLFPILKVAGTIYLIWLGLRMILSRTQFDFENQKNDESKTSIIRHGVLINLLNPKLSIFFFSFLPQYISENSGNYILDSLFYGFVFMVLTFIVFVLYGVFAGTMREFVKGYPKVLNRIQKAFGIIFIIFAIELASSSL